MNKQLLIIFILLIFNSLASFGQPLTVSMSSFNNVLICDCPDGDGDITAIPSGGTSPYSYLWSNGATTATIGQLLPGTYTVTVTDSVMNTATNSLTITSNSSLFINISYIAPTQGNCNGLLFFNPLCSSTPVNAPSFYTWFDGFNYAGLVCNPSGLVPGGGTSIPSNCPSEPGNFYIDPDSAYTGPCYVLHTPLQQQYPCSSNTRITVYNQRKLNPQQLGFPVGLILSDATYGFPMAKLYDLQGNLLASTTTSFASIQILDSVVIDFGWNVTGDYVFEYYESIYNGDTLGVHLKDTFNFVANDCGTFSGNIYYDGDANCAYSQGTDLLMPNTTLNIQPLNVNVLTNDSGQFVAYLPFGSYTATQSNPYGFDQECPSTLISFTLDSISPDYVLDIADTAAVGPACDLGVSIYSGAARPGFDYNINLHVDNGNLMNVPASVLTLTYDSTLQFISATNGGQAVGNVITWNVPFLGGFNSFLTGAILHVPVGTPVGSVLESTASISIEPCDTNSTNNTLMHQRTVTASFDPNQKTVSPVGAGAPHIIPPDYKLHYTVEFENTGNDTAFRVIIIDTLPVTLNPATFQVEMASHNYYVQIENPNIVRVTFDNILLPDSTTNPDASKGYVTFSIDQVPGLSDGTVISNNAGIYFDFNLPVITNSVFNTIKNGPVAVCQNIAVILDSTGNTFVDPVMLNNGSYDFYGITGYSVSQNSFNCSQTGVNPVMFYVSNMNGQTDSCAATITVTDNQIPVVLCHDTIISIDATCLVTISPQDVINSSSDNCSPLTHSLSQSTFDCTNIGLNTITLTTTDPSGNTIQCQVTVTIVDATGIHNSQSILQNFSIKPNPSSGKLSLPENSMGGAVVVSDYTGRTVYSENNIQIREKDFSMLPEGIYIFNFVTSKGEVRLKWLKID